MNTPIIHNDNKTTLRSNHVKLLCLLGICSAFAVIVVLVHHYRNNNSNPFFLGGNSDDIDPLLYSYEEQRFESLDQIKASTLFIGDSMLYSLVLDIEDRHNENDLDSDWTSLYRAGIVNRCIPGVTTHGVNKMLSHVNLSQSKQVIVWCGTNDFGIGRTSPEVAANYSIMLQTIRKSVPNGKLFVISILPVLNNERVCKGIKEFDEELPEIASENKAVFLDIRNLVCDSNGNLDRTSTFDGIHLRVSAMKKVETFLAASIQP